MTNKTGLDVLLGKTSNLTNMMNALSGNSPLTDTWPRKGRVLVKYAQAAISEYMERHPDGIEHIAIAVSETSQKFPNRCVLKFVSEVRNDDGIIDSESPNVYAEARLHTWEKEFFPKVVQETVLVEYQNLKGLVQKFMVESYPEISLDGSNPHVEILDSFLSQLVQRYEYVPVTVVSYDNDEPNPFLVILFGNREEDFYDLALVFHPLCLLLDQAHQRSQEILNKLKQGGNNA